MDVPSRKEISVPVDPGAGKKGVEFISIKPKVGY